MSIAEQPATAGAKNKIRVTVVYNGLDETFEWPPEMAVSAALAQAIQEFNVAGQRHTLALYRQDESEITQETLSLAESNIETGTILALKPSKVKGGAEWHR